MTFPSIVAPPPTPPIGPSIRFGTRLFTEPRRLGFGLIAPTQGIYAILVSDVNCRPRPFRVLYFGETENLMNRVCTAHEKFSDWQREAKGQDLYAAYYLTLGLTAEQRKDAERELIKKYDPPCNILLSPISGIAAMLKPHGNK